MSTFIARMIEQAAERSEEQGKAKYRAYFIKTNLYAKWKPDVDTILNASSFTVGDGEIFHTNQLC